MSKYQAQQIVGWLSMPLSQRRYRQGQLYILGVTEQEKLKAVDIRYFIEKDNALIPTRKGFRVNVGYLPVFLDALKKSPEKIGQSMISDNGSRSLQIRYCDDEYGEGVDIRYFMKTERYTGWDVRGLRLTLPDFAKLREAITALHLSSTRLPALPNLFVGREITSPAQERKGHKQSKRLQADEEYSDYINETILMLLTDDI